MGNDLYRSRLEKPINKKVLDFLSPIEEDLWIIEEDILGTQAHTIMLYEQKILNKDEIKEILISFEKLKLKLNENKLVIDKNFEDIHPFIEKYIIDDIGMNIGGKIHTGRSRNDQVSVDIRLKIRNELNRLANKLFEFCNSLLQISSKTINFYMPLYTHLQRGQLGVLSHYLNNYTAQILRSLKRIDETYHRINLSPLGACAIGGTSINISRKITAELLGFGGLIENSIDAVSSRDYIYETLMCLSLISIQYSRISEDLILWATKEFDFIELDEQFCSVSSVMPQKKNPDTLELIRSNCSKIISNLFTASLIIKGLPSGYFKDFQDLKMLLKSSLNLTSLITELLNNIIKTTTFNNKKMIDIVNDSYILALDLAELLVKEFNIPFRQSHEIIAMLIKNSRNPKDIFDKENIEKYILNTIKKEIIIPNDFIDSLKDLKSCLDKRISQGSPSEYEVKNVINNLNNEKNKLYNNYEERVRAVDNAKKNMEDLIKKLIK